MAHDWFVVEEVDRNTFVVCEPSHVRSYLIVGADRAVLFDSGLGVAPIRPVIESLTDRPVLVVNSHHHFDHAGGNHEFDDIAIHHSGADLLAAGPPQNWLSSYWSGFSMYLERLQTQPSTTGTPTPAGSSQRPRPLPSTFNPHQPAFTPTQPTQLLNDGFTIDLGGRTLVVLHTPGHTQDSICLLDTTHGLLFGGDTIDVGTIYAHLPTSDPQTFIASVEHVDTQLPPSVDVILTPHGGTGKAERHVIGDLHRALTRTANEGVALTPGKDCFLQDAAVGYVNGFSIYLPPDRLSSE